MLLQLLAIVAVMVHQINGCCLPSSFQFQVLSESSYGSYRSRSSSVMAADAARNKATIISQVEGGFESRMYVDFRASRVYHYYPSYGCYVSNISEHMMQQLNMSRCVPPELTSRPPLMRLRLANAVNASFYAGNYTMPGAYNATVNYDAVVDDYCHPILVKISGQYSDSLNIFGNFRNSPQAGILDLPAACNNATSYGKRHAKRHVKRHAIALGYGASPFVF